MFEENDLEEKRRLNNELEKEIQKLRLENNILYEKVIMFSQTINKINSVIFICDYCNEKIIWASDCEYFKILIGEDYLKCLNVLSESFIDRIHPEDRGLFLLKSLYFMENKGERYSVIFRIKIKNNTYKWFYLKINLSSYDVNLEEKKYLCFLTEFEDSFHSKSQINELNKSFFREKYSELISKLNSREIEIAKYLAKGKTRKEIAYLMNFKSTSTLNNHIKVLFLKTSSDNIAVLANLFSDFGFM